MIGNKKVGCLEYVDFPQLGIVNVLAKVDTGAYSGALHCQHIKVVRKIKDHRRVLKYVPLGIAELATETDQFEKIYVRSATGHRVKRYVISTTIKINGKKYQTKIGLSNRTDLRRQALIGRRFLRDNNLIVDVRKNETLDDEREVTS